MMEIVRDFSSSAEEANDKGVPEFGNIRVEQLRYPRKRSLPSREAVFNGAYAHLRESALRRVLYFGYGYGGARPYVHFPNAEHYQAIPFTFADWEHHGDMESEYGRIQKTQTYPTRVMPAAFDDITADVLQNFGHTLEEWGNRIPKTNEISVGVYDCLGGKMLAQKTKAESGYHNGVRGTFQSEPVFYEISPYSQELTIELWRRGVGQMAKELAQEDYGNVQAFLDLYRTIKDPLTGLRVSPAQVSAFHELHTRSLIQATGQPPKSGEPLAAQLALESAFLALPEARNVACVRFTDPHELPFIYVDPTALPRGEFANPKRVIEVLRELIDDSEKYKTAVTTPIAVSHFKEPFQRDPKLLIIDGNNRATATLLMRFVDFVNYDRKKLKDHHQALQRFVGLNDLDIEWEGDLDATLRSLSPDDIDLLLASQRSVRQFATSKIPALLVYEPNFHTIAVEQSQDGNITLLHPGHQTIYNDRRWAIAIPPKKQTHGRTKGGNIRATLESEIGWSTRS